MKNNILLVLDNSSDTNVLAQGLLESHHFDVYGVDGNRPEAIIHAAVQGANSQCYDVLIMDTSLLPSGYIPQGSAINSREFFPHGYFTKEQLIDLNGKFGLSLANCRLKISFAPGNVPFNVTEDDGGFSRSEMGQNVGFGIYDEIRKQESEKQKNVSEIKRIPIIFYTSRDISDLFASELLDTKNTFFIERPSPVDVVIQKIDSILGAKA